MYSSGKVVSGNVKCVDICTANTSRWIVEEMDAESTFTTSNSKGNGNVVECAQSIGGKLRGFHNTKHIQA